MKGNSVCIVVYLFSRFLHTSLFISSHTLSQLNTFNRMLHIFPIFWCLIIFLSMSLLRIMQIQSPYSAKEYLFCMQVWRDLKITWLVLLISYSKSQRDALFLKFILIKYSTCFGQIYCPSSGVSTLYTQQKVSVMLVNRLLERSGWTRFLTSLADGQHNLYDKYLLLCSRY